MAAERVVEARGAGLLRALELTEAAAPAIAACCEQGVLVIPAGPNVQESISKSASSTYEARDTLKTPHDEALFNYCMTSQLMLVPINGDPARPGLPKRGSRRALRRIT